MSGPSPESTGEHRPPAKSRGLSKPLFYGFAALCFAVFSSLLLTRTEPRRAQLTKAELGRPAKFDVRAQQAGYVFDDVTTKRLRDESSRKAPLVYAHAPGARERQVDLLHSAFAVGREAFDRYEAEVRAVRDAAAAAKGQLTKGASTVAPGAITPTVGAAGAAAGAAPAPGSAVTATGTATAPGTAPTPAPATDATAEPAADATSGAAASPAEHAKDSARELDIVDFDRRGKKRAPPVPADGPTTAEGRKLPKHVHRPIAARLAAAIKAKEVEVAKLLPLTPAELKVLSQLRYSQAAEQAAVRLLSVALDAVVVRDRMKFLVDQQAGIVLRGAGDQITRIEKVLSPADVLDIAGARAKLTDLAADQLPDTARPARDTLASVARRLVVENLVFDPEATARERTRARGLVQRQYRHYPRDSVIIRQGDIVKAEHLAILEAVAPPAGQDSTLRSYVGSGLFVLLLGALCVLATRTRAVRRKPAGRDYVFLGVWMLLSLFTVRVALEVAEALHDRWTDVPLSAFVLLIPFSLGALLVRLVLSSELAVLFAMMLAVLVAVMTGGGSYLAVYCFVGSGIL